MSMPAVLNLSGDRLGVYRGDTWGPKPIGLSRVVRDANGSLADATLTSATAEFVAEDVGIRVIPLLPDGKFDPVFPVLTIASRTDATTVELSAPLPAALNNRLLAIMRTDITDFVWVSQIRSTVDNETILAEITVTPLDEINGLIQLDMPPSETQKLSLVTDAVWDVQSTAPDGRVKTWLRGSVHAEKDTSR